MNNYTIIKENNFLEIVNSKITPWYQSNICQSSFVGKKNLTIKYMYALQKEPDKAIVMVPGRSECMMRYLDLIYEFYQMGYSVYILDHRGQGYSDRLTSINDMGHVDDFNNYVKDLKSFYEKVVQKQTHKQRFILTHSMGGCISALYMEKYPKDFDGAVMSAPMLGLNTNLPFRLIKLFISLRCFLKQNKKFASKKNSWNELDFKSQLNSKFYTHSKIRWEKDLKYYKEHAETRIGGPSVGWVYQSIQGINLAHKQAEKIQVPILIFQAGEDSIVENKGQEKWADAINKSPNKGSVQIVKIPEAFHVLFMEKDKYRIPVMKKATAFLEEISKCS